MTDTDPALLAQLDKLFQEQIVASLSQVIFFDLAFWDNGSDGEIVLPIVVVWLVLGALFFTLRFQFVNFRAFRHAIDCVRGRYTQPGETGEITHFQALSAALSATVGLGNIAGVAFAVGVGGPGAIFWMVCAGFLGMSSKFAECTLGQMYRVVRADGHVSGGPMHYLRDGLAELRWPRAGRVVAAVFALMCIGGSFGGGNMYQANQAYAQIASVMPVMFDGIWGAVAFGLVLSTLVGTVIVGGIRRIGEVAAFLVPIMCVIYVTSGLFILLSHASALPAALATIVSQAFSLEAGVGGLIGAIIQGFRRAAFSNEAGTGSASIAHSAAATNEPVREGLVALLEPFIDTIVVCSMTGLVIVVTGAHLQGFDGGIQMTSWAFDSAIPGFRYVLSLCAILFAFSTMISWSYYGEQCWAQLFGLGSILVFKLIFLLFAWAGAIFAAKAVVDFGDLMILGMAFPNIIGVVLLSGKVKAKLDDYLARLKAGEFELATTSSPASAPGLNSSP